MIVSSVPQLTPLHPTQLRKRWPTPLVHLIAHRADGPYVACAYGLDGDTAVDDPAQLTCEHCKFIARYRAKGGAE